MQSDLTIRQGDIWSDNWTAAMRKEAKLLAGPIWVVGASGFIGSKMYHSLSKIRDDVYAVSRVRGMGWRFKKEKVGRFVILDIGSGACVSRAVRRYKPMTVFNFAAYGGYEHQNRHTLIHQTNYIGTLNLLTALTDTGCKAFVQAGSSSEYGTNCNAPSEFAYLEPNSEYATSKAAASFLVRYYGQIRGLPCSHLRLYSIYGPWEEPSRLIPTIIRFGRQGRFPPLVRPRISRDFVYVDDCTHSFVRAALTVSLSHRGDAYNIATGKKTSLAEVASHARELFQIKERPTFGTMKDRNWDLENWCGCATKARREMAWRYRTSFKEGLRQTLAWSLRMDAHNILPPHSCMG